MQWKFTGGGSVYRQIIQQLQDAILSGQFPPGSRLPSERELAAQAQVNPNTMQHALTNLEQTGLLVSNSTAGRWITDNEVILSATREQVLEKLAREYAARFADLGVSPEQAAELLLRLAEKEEA